MDIPNSNQEHLTHEERFRAMLSKLVSITPDELQRREREHAEARPPHRKRGPKPKAKA
jgi:hypothetical protein